MFISSIRNAKSYCSLHWVLLLRKTIENHSVEPSLFLSLIYFPSKYFQFRSVTQSCPTLCDPMNRSTPGLPVHHQLPEFTQTHVHRVGDAIQPSSSVVPFSSSLQSLSIRVFSDESVLRIRWPKYQNFSFSTSPNILSF